MEDRAQPQGLGACHIITKAAKDLSKAIVQYPIQSCFLMWSLLLFEHILKLNNALICFIAFNIISDLMLLFHPD